MYNFNSNSVIGRAMAWINSPTFLAALVSLVIVAAIRSEVAWRVAMTGSETHTMCNEVRELVVRAADLGGTEFHRPELSAVAETLQWGVGRDESWWPAAEAATARHIVAQSLRKEARAIYERAFSNLEARLGLNEKRLPDSGPLPATVAGRTIH